MKKLSLIALFALFSMFFLVSCVSDDDEEEAVDTGTGDTQSDTGADTTDSGTDTTDTGADTTDSGADTTDTGADTTDTGADTTDTGADTTDSGTDTTDTGADTTDSGADSGSEGDDSNLNTGDTSGNQAAKGAVGAACTSDSDCKGSYGSGDDEHTPSCLAAKEGFTGGYCSYFSDDGKACSNAGETHYEYNSWGDGFCYHKCTKPSDCRVGYRCSNKAHLCMPDCKKAGYECFYGECDQTDGVCLK